MDRRRSGQGHQHRRREQPDADRDSAQAGDVDRQQRGGVGDDPGAHHRGKPVRAEMPERRWSGFHARRIEPAHRSAPVGYGGLHSDVE